MSNSQLKIVCVFGASTVWGAWDLEKGGWVNRLRLYLESKDKHAFEVYNLGITGETTRDVLKRFDVEAEAREPNIVFLAIGVNDTIWDMDKKAFWTDITQFEKNIKELIQRARKYTQTIILLDIQNVDESRTTPISWEKNLHYKNETIEKYNTVLEAIAKEEGLLYISVFGLLNNEDLEDGLHPNAQGHQKIFEKVKTFLEKKLV